VSQSEGREVASSCRGRLRERDTGGDATTVARGDAMRGKGMSSVTPRVREQKGAAS